MEYVLVGITAFVVSVVSAISGGGGGMVMTPLLLLMGFAPQTALASSKSSGLGISLGTLGKFTKEKGLIQWNLAVYLSILAVIASIFGTQVVFILDAETLKKLVGLITVGLVPVLFFSRKVGLKNIKVRRPVKLLGIFLYFIILSAQAGLGSGIGILLMPVMMGMMGFDALRANATKRVAGLTLACVSFAIFSFSDYMDWLLAVSLGMGMLFGGYVGAHLAVKHGSLFVKRTLLIVSLIIGLSVLFG